MIIFADDMSSVSASIIIPAWNGQQFIGPCLHSLRECTSEPYETIIVDNGSSDQTVALAREAQVTHLITNAYNTGFAYAVNQGLQMAQADVLILLNQDIVAQPGWLTPILERLQTEADVGIVGCKLLYPDGQVQHAGGQFLEPSLEGIHHHEDGGAQVPHHIDFVTGAAFAIRRACWQAVGEFDEGFDPAYFEDVDYCLRATAAGWRVVYEPRSVLIHHESQSRGANFEHTIIFHSQRMRLALKHRPLDWILGTFVPNEATRTRTSPSFDFLYSMAHVYLQAARHARAVRPASEWAALSRAFFDLRALAMACADETKVP